MSRERALTGSLWFAASQLLPLVGTAALSVVMARVLGAEDLGLQSLVTYVEALVATLVVGSLTQASIRTLAATGLADGPRIAWWVGALHLLGTGVVAGVLAAVGLLRDPDERTLWWLVVASTVVGGVGWSYAARHVAATGWTRFARWRLACQVTSAVLGVGAVLAGLGVAGVLAAAVLAALANLVLLARRVPGPRPRRGPAPRGLLAAWSRFAGVEVVTQVVARRPELLVLGALATTTQVAHFSVPTMVVGVVTTTTSSLLLTGVPAIARASSSGRDAEVCAALGRVLRVALALGVPLAAAVAALGPALVESVYGAAFAPAAALVLVVAPAILVVPLGQACSAYWTGVARVRPLVLTGLAAGGVGLLVALALVPSQGARGAAVASLLGQSSAALSLTVLTWRRVGRPALGLVRAAAGLPAALLAVAAGNGLAATLGPVAGLLLGAPLVAAVLLAHGWWAGHLAPADARWLLAALPRLPLPDRVGLRLLGGPRA